MHHQDTKTPRKRKAEGRSSRLLLLVFPWCLCVLVVRLLPSVSLPAGACLSSQVKPAAPVSKSPQQAFILRSQTNEVLVDVRVYDKSGKPVTDLKQSDFRVTEDGVPQTISDFSLEDVEKLAQATGGERARAGHRPRQASARGQCRAGAPGPSPAGLFL